MPGKWGYRPSGFGSFHIYDFAVTRDLVWLQGLKPQRQTTSVAAAKRCKEPPPRADNTSTQRRKKRAAYPADYDYGLSLSKVRKPISVENIDDGNDGKQDAEESEPTRHLLVANKHRLLPRMNITSPVQRLTPTGVRRTGF